jgi:hypothetical protein
VRADPPPLDAVVGRSYDQTMTTREKLIAIIDGMSETELRAEHDRLERASRRASDEEFQRTLDDVREFREELFSSSDITQLIRDEREWHASRVP